VKPYIPGTDRKDFLAAARAQSADYYVTGYLTAVGAEVSLVSQIVSTYSGTVIWSQSALVKTYADADAQANLIRDAILHREGRYFASINAPTAAPEATTRPNEKNNEGGFAIGGRRRRQRASAPAEPSSAPVASIAQSGATPPPDVNTAPHAGQLPPPPASANASAAASLSPATATPLPPATPLPGASPASPDAAPPAKPARKTRARADRANASPTFSPPASPAAAASPAATASPTSTTTASAPTTPAGAIAPFSRGSGFGYLASAARRHPSYHARRGAARGAVATSASGSQVSVAGAPLGLVLLVAGNADAKDRDYAGSALAFALRRDGHPVRTASDASSLVPDRARELCDRNPGVATIYATSLSLRRTNGTMVHFSNATLDFSGYDCAGMLVGRQHVESTASGVFSVNSAIDRATARAVSGLLHATSAPSAATPQA